MFLKNKSLRFFSIFFLIFCILTAITFYGVLNKKQSLPPYIGKDLTTKEMNEVIKRNSSLTSYVHLTENADFPRQSKIKKITIHHMGANLTLEKLGESFSKRDRQASSNYAIDVHGNVALYVEEENRAWTSANADNDHQAITIEVANETIGGDWKISDQSYQKLIELCVDICQRHSIEKLVYTGDKNGNLTIHKMFDADTICPGPYLESKMTDIAKSVNEKLENETKG